MGGGDWLSVLYFFVLFARCYFGHIFCFLYHISLLSLLNMLLSRLFRMGGSDYLDDNPMKKHFSGKEKSIFSLFWDGKKDFRRRRRFSCIFHVPFSLNSHSGESYLALHDAPWLGKLLDTRNLEVNFKIFCVET
jgi:hypothetical protein